MSKLHSQLALFGAIDQEVVDAKARLRRGDGDDAADTEVIEMVEGFLPGTTGFGQHGWYQQLFTFLATKTSTRGGSEGVTFPDLETAITQLVTRTSVAEVEEKEREDERDPVLARAAYAAVVLEKIYRRRGRSADIEPLEILDRALGGWPPEQGGSADLLKARIDAISDRQDWVLEVRSVVSDEFANCSGPCFGALKKVDGQYCAYITTDTTADDLTVKDIAKIIEPINWSACCKFFCKMTNQTPDPYTNPGGWSRVIERISGECKEYWLDTDLIFWKAQLPDGSIYINYDLDPHRTGSDSKLVEVDSGYLWISPRQPKGVRIRTSKLERVSGLSPTATAALACMMGWGDTGHEMLAGTARKYMKDPTRPPTMTPFRNSPNDQTAYKG